MGHQAGKASVAWGRPWCGLWALLLCMTSLPAQAALDSWEIVSEPGPGQFLNITRFGEVQLATTDGVLFRGSAGGLAVQLTDLRAAPKFISAGNQRGSFAQHSGRVLYAAVDGHGVYRSADSGATWSRLTTDFPAGTVTALVGAHNATRTVYIGLEAGGVYAYSASTGKWTDITMTLPVGKVYQLAISPADSERVYAAIEGEGVHKLVKPNKASKWIKVSNLNGIQDIAVHPVNPHEALISSGGTVERIESNNVSGASWSLRDGLPGGAVMWGLAYDPQDPDFAYVGTTRGVYKLNRGLGVWSRLGADGDLGNQYVVAIEVDPRDNKVVYAATNNAAGGGRLYRIEQSVSSNVAPEVNIQVSNTRVASFETVVLDGASSVDPDGIIESYKWVELSGARISINGDESPTASFVAPDVTLPITLLFQLEVIDNKGAWAGGSVEVVVHPHGFKHAFADDAELDAADSGSGGGGGSLGWSLLLSLLLARRYLRA